MLAPGIENPFRRGDPHAKVGDTYYAIGTGKAADGKQFPILRSRNFTDWEVVGGAMDAIEGMKEYWAPEIVERDGKFYLPSSLVSFCAARL